jgi:hypothetical protein
MIYSSDRYVVNFALNVGLVSHVANRHREFSLCFDHN